MGKQRHDRSRFRDADDGGWLRPGTNSRRPRQCEAKVNVNGRAAEALLTSRSARYVQFAGATVSTALASCSVGTRVRFRAIAKGIYRGSSTACCTFSPTHLYLLVGIHIERGGCARQCLDEDLRNDGPEVALQLRRSMDDAVHGQFGAAHFCNCARALRSSANDVETDRRKHRSSGFQL